jgi:hypothetical protein
VQAEQLGRFRAEAAAAAWPARASAAAGRRKRAAPPPQQPQKSVAALFKRRQSSQPAESEASAAAGGGGCSGGGGDDDEVVELSATTSVAPPAAAADAEPAADAPPVTSEGVASANADSGDASAAAGAAAAGSGASAAPPADELPSQPPQLSADGGRELALEAWMEAFGDTPAAEHAARIAEVICGLLRTRHRREEAGVWMRRAARLARARGERWNAVVASAQATVQQEHVRLTGAAMSWL